MGGIDKMNSAITKQAVAEATTDALGDRTDPEAIKIRNQAAVDMTKSKQLASFGEGEFENETFYFGLATQLLKVRTA